MSRTVKVKWCGLKIISTRNAGPYSCPPGIMQRGGYAVTLDPPSASAITARAADVSAWLIRWRQWAAQHPGVTLRDKKIHTKFGDQPVYTHLDIPDTWFRANPL